MRTLLFVLTLGALCAAEASAQLLVTRVVDGDTYELSDGRRVRLIGVDTPELHASAKLERDAERTGRDARTIQALGEAASRYAKQLMTGREVVLEFDPANAATGHRDRYGRTLAYVWVVRGSQRLFMANARTIADGYANAYTAFPFRYRDEFVALEREARTAGRGLCASNATEAPAPAPAGLRFDPKGPDRDCSDFRTQAEAQAFFLAAGPGDPHRLDADGNGLACESLPTGR